jgi:ribose transport system substrate-binding protein
LVGLTVLALSVAGCGGDDSESSATSGASTSSSGGKKKIAVIVPLSNTFTAALYEGMKAQAEGTDVELKVFDPGFDPQKAYAQIQQITAQGGYDGIAMLPLDPATAVPAVKAAAEKGIKVVSMNNPLGPDMKTLDPQVPGQTANVMDASQYQRGLWLGELAVDACAEQNPCDVAYVAGSMALAGEQALIGGFKESIAKNPAIKLAAYRDAGGYLPEPGQKITQNILQANRDIKVIAGSGDQIIRGAELAVKQAGLEGKVALIGLGGSKLGVEGVKSGKWFGSVANLPYSIGQASFDILEQAFADENVEGVAVNVAEDLGLDPKITADNAADFKPEWDG